MSTLGTKNTTTAVADLTNGFVNTEQTGIVLVTFGNNDATPTVAGSNSFLASNATPLSITNFDDGVQGQLIRIKFTNGNTTIVHDVTKIKLRGGANLTPATNTTLTFERDASNIWWEISNGNVVGSGVQSIIYEDFICNLAVGSQPAPLVIADHAWFKTNSGAGSAVGEDSNDHGADVIGAMLLEPGTNAGGTHDTAGISHCDGGTVTCPFFTSQAGLKFQWKFQLGNDDGTLFTRAALWFGLTAVNGAGSGTDGNDEIAFVFWESDQDYKDAGDSPSVFASTKNGGTHTSTDLGAIAAYKGSFHTAAIEIVSSSSIKFYLDGSLVATHTTNIPATTTALRLRMSLHTRGSTDPASKQHAYFDIFRLDGPSIDRGEFL